MTTAELCLSKDEVRQLSRTPQKARQLEFLRRNGIRHYVDAYGWPVVLRSAVGPRPHNRQHRPPGSQTRLGDPLPVDGPKLGKISSLVTSGEIFRAFDDDP